MREDGLGRRRLGFLNGVVLPLVAGTAITAAGLAGLAAWSGTSLFDAVGEPAQTGATGPVAVVAEPEFVNPADRVVSPEGVTPGPRIDGPLLRIAPERGVDPGAREPETVYRRVVVLDGSHFRTVRDRQPIVVRLDGIRAPAFRDTCTDTDGTVWKCGARARAELARLILNRSVTCVVVDETDPAAPVGRCKIGVYDLSEWMVRRGWADAAPDGGERLEDAAAEAREKRRGRFGPAPQGVIAG